MHRPNHTQPAEKTATVEEPSAPKQNCAALPPDTVKPETKPSTLTNDLKQETAATDPAPTYKYARRWNASGFFVNPIKAIVAAPGEMYRTSVSEFHAGVKDMTNNSTHSYVTVPAAIITLPFSIAAGCTAGAASAIKYGKTAEPTAPKLAGAKSPLN